MVEKRVGEERINNQGYLMKIVGYVNSEKIYVEFQSEPKNVVITRYCLFKKGHTRNPFHKSVNGVGYIGELGNTPSFCSNYKNAYSFWGRMMDRCYNERCKILHPEYRNCTCDYEWHNFSNFNAWYDDNYYQVSDDFMCLDKDILYKNNKKYSKECCIFVPNRINTLFVKRDSSRGKYPVGVAEFSTHRILHPYYSHVMIENGIKFCGSFDNPTDAFYAYKCEKERYIKEVAEKYKDKIPLKLYDALCKYIVEITD